MASKNEERNLPGLIPKEQDLSSYLQGIIRDQYSEIERMKNERLRMLFVPGLQIYVKPSRLLAFLSLCGLGYVVGRNLYLWVLG